MHFAAIVSKKRISLLQVVAVGHEVFSHVSSSSGDHPSPFPPVWVEVVINLNHVALFVNASVNIVIYICKDKTFRRAFTNMLAWGKRNRRYAGY